MRDILRNILLSERPLLISHEGYRQLLSLAFPPPGTSAQHSADQLTPYDRQHRAQTAIAQSLSQSLSAATDDAGVLTDDYLNDSLPDDSVAYHGIFGLITASSTGFFSTRQLERDLMAAEANPRITSHLLHISSPGGEAYYLDRLSETLQLLVSKPVVTLFEKYMCSAAYYIGCHGQRVYATTPLDFVGCIGAMVSFHNFDPYFAQMGIRLVEAKADQSDLKNKMFDDLTDGRPQQYVEQVLNPLNDAFLACVKRERKQLGELSNEAPVLRGETFLAQEGLKVGLCDGIRRLPEAVAECRQLGREWRDRQQDERLLYSQL